MNGTTTIQKNKGLINIGSKNLLHRKAAFLDEILNFIEEKSLGYLMEETEKEINIPFQKAKKQIK